MEPYSSGGYPTVSGTGTWLPEVTSPDAVTDRVVTADTPATIRSAPYAALPSVSMPAGEVPASVPVPAGNTGVGLTALDEGAIDLDAPLPPYSRQSPSYPASPPSPYPPLPPASGYSPPMPSYPSHPPTSSSTGWDVVVGDVGV